MTSVWISRRSGVSKIEGNLSFMGAILALEKRCIKWTGEKPGNCVVRISNLEIHLLSENSASPVAHLYIEPYSPPTKPIGGDIYRRAGAQK